MKRLLLFCITSLLCGLPSAWASESDVTVHGEREVAEEDPLNPTATNETVRVRPESPTIGHTLERATGVDIRRDGNMGRGEFIQLRGADPRNPWAKRRPQHLTNGLLSDGSGKSGRRLRGLRFRRTGRRNSPKVQPSKPKINPCVRSVGQLWLLFAGGIYSI